MGLFDRFKKKPVVKKKVSTKQVTRQVTNPKPKQTKNQKSVTLEAPMFTVSRQLTHLQDHMTQLDTMVRAGFQGLRDDHHKILDDQLTRADLDDYRKGIDTRKEKLKERKQEIEKEIEIMEIDKKILDVLSGDKLQNTAVAQKLGVARQYASTRISNLVDLGLVSRVKDGRKMFYETRKTNN